MIILDTNVCSELLRAQPSPKVLEWVKHLGQVPYTTVITQAELLSGVAVLPEGKRKQTLREGIQRILSAVNGCLPLTSAAAESYADIISIRRASGYPISSFDALIAAIAVVNHAAIATRNVKDFQLLGLDIINPWENE